MNQTIIDICDNIARSGVEDIDETVVENSIQEVDENFFLQAMHITHVAGGFLLLLNEFTIRFQYRDLTNFKFI